MLYSLIHHITCRFEARQALIYQLASGLMGENGKYNYSKAVHLYPPFFDIFCSPKNYKTASALTIKTHLERETQRTGRKLTQREFVLGLIEEALEAAERQAVEDIPEPEEEQPSEDAGVSPCEAGLEDGSAQPQEEDTPAALSA